MKTLVWEYDDTTALEGRIKYIDMTFDHGLGIARRHDFEVVDFCVLAFIGQQWEPVSLLNPSVMNFYREQFLEWAISQNEKAG